MLSKIIKNSVNVPKTCGYKLENDLATLVNEEEACKRPKWAYYFARDVPGADREKCQEAACMYPYYAFCFARDIPVANIETCYEAAYKSPLYAYLFDLYIPGGEYRKVPRSCI
jgi:hypothetical protein